MRGREQNLSAGRGTLHRAALLTLVVALLAAALFPLAYFFGGMQGIGEMGVAAGICLVAGWASELLGTAFTGPSAALLGMMVGMGARMLPPLVVCGVIALGGANGRQYLAFVVYLLTFYLATLAFETWSAISRVTHSVSPQNHGG